MELFTRETIENYTSDPYAKNDLNTPKKRYCRLQELSEEIFPYIDSMFTINESENTFDEMPHKVKT